MQQCGQHPTPTRKRVCRTNCISCPSQALGGMILQPGAWCKRGHVHMMPDHLSLAICFARQLVTATMCGALPSTENECRSHEVLQVLHLPRLEPQAAPLSMLPCRFRNDSHTWRVALTTPRATSCTPFTAALKTWSSSRQAGGVGHASRNIRCSSPVSRPAALPGITHAHAACACQLLSTAHQTSQHSLESESSCCCFLVVTA